MQWLLWKDFQLKGENSMPRGRPKGSKNKGNSNKGTFTKLNKSGLKESKFDEETIKKLRQMRASDAAIRMHESPYQCTCCGM
jgi:hypothetical protein